MNLASNFKLHNCWAKFIRTRDRLMHTLNTLTSFRCSWHYTWLNLYEDEYKQKIVQCRHSYSHRHLICTWLLCTIKPSRRWKWNLFVQWQSYSIRGGNLCENSANMSSLSLRFLGESKNHRQHSRTKVNKYKSLLSFCPRSKYYDRADYRLLWVPLE